LPRGAVCLPARDIGPPYLARFSGVSGTGPLVESVVVTLAFWPATSAELVVVVLVTPVDEDVVAEVVSVLCVVVSAGAGAAVVVVVDEELVDWA
jgi:hypothetical protein